MRNLVVTSLIFVLLISTATIVLSLLLVTKQGISVAASAAASEFKFDPNAKRFHSNINCNDFAQMTRSSNAADKATIVVDALHTKSSHHGLLHLEMMDRIFTKTIVQMIMVVVVAIHLTY